MKSMTFLAGLTAVSMLTSTAFAGEWADACIAALEADGRDTSGCQCLEDAISGNDALIEEFTALGAIADAAERYGSASDEAKAVMDACTR